MASPQLENGYTSIANEIMEAIASSGLNGTELAIILFLLRKTYGWKKKDDEISLSQFLVKIPVSKPTLCKALKTLQLVKIIKLVKKGNSKISSNCWSFNKNYDEWQLVKKTKLVKFSKSTSKDFDFQLVKKPLHTKEIRTKENTKEILSLGSDEPYVFAEKIKLMTISKDRRMIIIAYYWVSKGILYPNQDQYESGLKRELRPAGLLKGYDNDKIKKTITWLKDNADFKWTLETVHKYIDENLDNMGAGGKKLTEDELLKIKLKQY